MHKNYFIRLTTLGIFILSLLTTGCAAKKNMWGDLQTGLILKYSFPKDQTLTYKNAYDTVQNLELMGQSMKTTIKGGSSYSFKGIGVDDQSNLMTQVIINSLAIAINSQQGNVNPDTSGLIGKSFNATYSPNGKELKVTGIEDLPKISLGQSGERSANEFFSDLLSELPETAIKTGESWMSPIERSLQQGPLTISIKGEATSTLEGIETIQGMECAKIKTLTKNTVQGSGTQMGMEIKLKGESTAASTWYFAYKKGMLVKITSDEDSDIMINAGTMEIPQTSKSKTEVNLVL